MTGERKARKRPFGVNVIMVLQFVVAILVLIPLIWAIYDPSMAELQGDDFVRASFDYVFSGAMILASWGLLRLKRWGWILTMILTGSSLASNIWQYFQGIPDFFDMAINVVIVFYLYQRDVQASFTRKRLAKGAQ